MTRVTSYGSIAIRSAGFKAPSGAQWAFLNDTTSYTRDKVARADVTRNRMDTGGWRKPSAYWCTVTSADAGFVDIEVSTTAGYTYYNQGMLAPHTGVPAVQLDESYIVNQLPAVTRVDQAVILARNNVADRVASFGESLAELMKTLEGLGSLATAIDLFLEAAAKKDTTAMAKALGVKPASRKHRRAVSRWKGLGPTVANAWLSWNFGLAPIISDMVALAILLGEGKNLRVSGRAVVFEKDSPVIIENTHAMSFGPATYQTAHNVVKRRGTYVRLDYEVSLETLRSLTSYGLLDAPATAWALVPYSFLVDFALPVSEVLRSLTATFGLSFRGGSATRFVKVDWKFAFARFPETPSYAWTKKTVLLNDVKGAHMERTVFKSDPNPVTLWMKDPLSAFSVATTFAVLTQKLRRYF